ncbi:MAG TPA: hypothetical protein VJB60_03765 [Candidatus Peribacterales bacterium]|nr:hypothetical protein [Candidatus Peribacterales bacterium]
MPSTEQIRAFVDMLWEWHGNHKRLLPWRDLTIKNDTERAYRILVSEVMLQQTQVSRVILIYKRFLREFPKIQDLAHASNRGVILAWRGMGYNSRALRLRDAAQIILREHGGKFPKEMEELQSIPGIGHYTAAAIRNFAFHIPTPCIETNIRRVLHTIFFGPPNEDGTWRVSDRELLTLAEEVLHHALKVSRFWFLVSGYEKKKNGEPITRNQKPVTSATADWHAALMDYGALAMPKIRPKRRILRKEPGRLVGSRHIPNRIFRGKIIEELRDAKRGLTLSEIGRNVCIDWEPEDHKEWLEELLTKLKKDALIERSGKKFMLCT